MRLKIPVSSANKKTTVGKVLLEDFLRQKPGMVFFLFIVRLSNKCEYLESQRLNNRRTKNILRMEK
jgi:hypothetical protein